LTPDSQIAVERVRCRCRHGYAHRLRFGVSVNFAEPRRTGEHKGFWNWTLRAAAQGLVREGTLTPDRLEELVAGMTEADASRDTVVTHCRMHQLIARKPTTSP
jgi:hypothetical protein